MSDAATLTLSDFLLARIAEDEARINKWQAGGALWPHEDHDIGECDECDHRRSHRSADDRLADRMRAECAAKRHIVERCSPNRAEFTPVYLAVGVLTDLAAVYADHPDYRPEWAL